MTFDVFPKNTTNTAQKAAVAVKTSCRLARVKREQEPEKVSVNRNIVMICSQFLRVTWDGSFGCSCTSIITGASRRTTAMIVRMVPRKISRRRGDISLMAGSSDCSCWTRLRNIFCEELDMYSEGETLNLPGRQR